MADRPKGLKPYMIAKWCKEYQFIPKAFYEAVIKAYKEAPDFVHAAPVKPRILDAKRDPDYHWLAKRKGDKAPNTPPGPRRAVSRVAISDEMRDHLNREFERTGLSVSGLLRMRPAELRPLSSVTLSKWRNGKAETANKEDWGFVLNVLESLPEPKR